MADQKEKSGNDWSDLQEGWENSMMRLSSAFTLAAFLSYGLNLKEIELLIDYLTLVNNCLRSIAVSEKLYPWWPK